MNFVDMILFHAQANPERPAVAFSERVLNYRQMGQGIRSAERRLVEIGVKPGDLVAIEIDHPMPHLTLIYALYRLGAASISLATGTKEPIDHLGIALLLKERQGGIAFSGRVERIDERWFAGPPLANGGGRGFTDPNQICRVMLSSGTTGRPKAMALSAAAFEDRQIAYTLRTSTPSWSRMLCLPGLSTAFGFLNAVMALPLGRMVCFTQANADSALRMIEHHGLDFLVASTHQLLTMADLQAKRPLPCASLRVVHVGGSILTAAFISQVRSLLCNMVICIYGSTEAGTVALAPAEQLRGIDGAVGFVTPWAQVEILDANGSICPRGQEGTLRIHTGSHTRPYGEGTGAEADGNIRDGWFYPGDLARMTEEGILVITGRSGEAINTGGTKLAPELIEELLLGHPDVADAGVAGMLGGAGVEEIWAAIVARREIAAQAIVDYCRQAKPGMTPRHIRFVAAIPRNAMGKVAREQLRQLLMK